MVAFPGWGGWDDHIHVSERQPGKWVDCTWMSAVEFARAVDQDRGIPATHAEGDALRAASGDLVGGSSLKDLNRGLENRYGWSYPERSGFNEIWSLLVPGTVAVIQGDMGNFPDGHRLRRWDPNFEGNHSICGSRLDAQDRIWWCDPLAPAGGTYEGEWVSKAELKLYLRYWGLAEIAPFGGQNDEMLVRETVVPLEGGARPFRIAAGSTISGYDPARPGKAILTKTWPDASSASADAREWISYPGTTNPPVPRGGPFLRVVNGYYQGLIIVEAYVTLAPEPPAPADTTPYSEADLAAAKAAGIVTGNAASDKEWETWVGTRPKG